MDACPPLDSPVRPAQGPVPQRLRGCVNTEAGPAGVGAWTELLSGQRRGPCTLGP